MNAFTFRLERVLHWRITSLRLEEARLKQTRATLEVARTERERLSHALSQAKQQTETFLTGADLLALDRYAASLDKQVALSDQRITALSEATAKQTLVVARCDRDARLLERLRCRRLAEWQTGINRELESQMSDFSGSKWLRARSASEATTEASER
jgi:hypothetical protein